ncbi:MAG: acyltransferase [Halobacteriales archaeon]
MTKRRVELPEPTAETYETYVATVRDRLRSDEPLGDVVQEVLVDLNGDRERFERWRSGGTVATAEATRLANYHPDNAALESEWYAEKDEAAFARSKPLQWLWRQFDRTPMAVNVTFGLAFRQMLAAELFAEAGDDLRIFRGVTMSYGHNITVGDNTVIHDGVHLDDRGELRIGDRVSISEGVHVYTHDHDLVDQTSVTNYRTIIEDDVRLTYDAMVRAGVRIGENALVGAKSVVQADVPAHHVAVGSPARSVRIKPGWESVARGLEADAPGDRADRRLETPIADDIEEFDEFQRDLEPPDA